MKEKSKQIYFAIWNLMGNIVYAICIWLLTFTISKHSISGDYSDAAVFAIATSFGVVFNVISSYGLRTFQVSDSDNEFMDSEYITLRLFTIFLGGSLCFLLSLLFNYSLQQVLAINLYMLYQNVYAYSDVLHGIIQKGGRIDECGKSLCIRGVAKTIGFAITLYLSDSLLLALCALVIFGGGVVVFYDIPKARGYYAGEFLKVDFTNSKVWHLLRKGFPMLVFTVLGSLTMYAPRIILEKLSGDAAVGIFSYVFAPTIVITTFAAGIMIPFIPQTSKMYAQREVRSVIKLVAIPLVLIAFVGLCAIITSLWIGDWVLYFLYDSSVSQFKVLLALMMLVNTLWALAYCCNNLFIIARKFRTLISLNLAGFFITVLLCMALIPQYGIYGVGFAMIAGVLMQLLLSIVTVVIILFYLNCGVNRYGCLNKKS